MLSPIGVVVGVILTQRLLTFKQDVEILANSGPKAEDFLTKPKGFFGKRRYRKKLNKKKEELETRKQNVYSNYYMGIGLVFICSIFGGYSVMIPVAMLIATAFNKELFPSSIPIIGKDQTKYVNIWNRYVQSDVHLLLGADGEYDQKLMKRYNRRKAFFFYRWFTKETKALKNLEKSLNTDSDVMMDFMKSFFVSFLKFTILLAPVDLLVRFFLGEYSSLAPQITWTVSDFYLNALFCCLGMVGAVAGVSLMKIAISSNPKVKLLQNKQTTTVLPSPPIIPQGYRTHPVMRTQNIAPPLPMIHQPQQFAPPMIPQPQQFAPPMIPQPQQFAPPMIPQPQQPPPVTRTQTVDLPQASIQPANTLNPPIPPEGLPPGWTIQQWNHYGAQWLRNQNR